MHNRASSGPHIKNTFRPQQVVGRGDRTARQAEHGGSLSRGGQGFAMRQFARFYGATQSCEELDRQGARYVWIDAEQGWEVNWHGEKP